MFRVIGRGTRRATLIGSLSVLAGLGGCSATDVLLRDLDPAEVPPFSTSDAVAPASVIFGCGQWRSPEPLPDRVWADVYFQNGNSNTSRLFDRPSAVQLRALERVGARLLYTFHFPIARVDIPTGAIRTLWTQDLDLVKLVNHVREVPFRNRFDVYATVHYNNASEGPSVAQVVEATGGGFVGTSPSVRFLTALLPDTSAAIVRAHSAVHQIGIANMGCLLGDPLTLD